MKRLLCVLSMMILGSGPVLGQVLFDGALGTSPASQGWSFISVPVPATETGTGTGVQLDTLVLSTVLAGYSRLAPTPLDPADGFRVAFMLRLLEEAHNTTNRAGLSIVVLGADKRGLELAFWPDRVWAQSDAPLFTHAEEALFDTTAASVTYELAFTATSYVLRADGEELLTGPVRDYTAFTGTIDPYKTPNFLFIGDDTTSAKAAFSLSRVEVTVNPPAPAVTFAVSMADSSSLTLNWPSGYKLQRATTLSPPDWADFATDSPMAVPLNGPDAFFRAVPR